MSLTKTVSVNTIQVERHKGVGMQVVDPTGVASAPGNVSVRDWQLDLQGQTVGVLWNGKPNADNLFREVERRLRREFGVKEVIWANKAVEAAGPSLPATEAIYNRLSSGAVAVLAGSGD